MRWDHAMTKKFLITKVDCTCQFKFVLQKYSCSIPISFIKILNFLSKVFFSPQLVYKEVGSYFLAVLSWISALQEWIQGIKDICQFSELPYPPIKILKLVISWSLHPQVSNLVDNWPYAGLTWVWVVEFSRGDTKLERFLP